MSRTNTEASTDLLGFVGDYDKRRLDVDLQLRFPLGSHLHGRLAGSLGWERYPNRNVIDFLTDEGIGTPTPSRRRDAILTATAALGWSLTRNLQIEVRWRGERHRSNVDVYDYKRSVVGVYVTAQRSLR